MISGDLGRVAPVKASGDDGTSRSIPAKTPDGIVLGDGFVSVTTSTGQGTASAQAEADDVELLGGVVTAAFVAPLGRGQGRRREVPRHRSWDSSWATARSTK